MADMQPAAPLLFPQFAPNLQAALPSREMIARIRRLFHRPIFLLGLSAFLTALVVQSGELGSSDTTHRLQAAHSFWTSQPAVFPNEYPEFGIHGRHGKLYGWYGIGQSLLMLPADVVGTYVERLRVFAAYNGNDPSVRDIIVSYNTNILLCVLTMLVLFRLLRLFDFTINQAVAGCLALLFGTTFLHYTQNMMENNYIMLLTMTGLTFQYEWLRTGRRCSLVIGSLALGLNLLTRLTTALELLAVGLFLLLASWSDAVHGRALRQALAAYIRITLPIYAIFGLLDRVYHYYRFGSLFTTYLGIWGKEQRLLNPDLPFKFPWNTPFHAGFLGPLITPEKSIFLFDPLIVLTIVLAVVLWRRLRPQIKAYLVTFGVLLLAYICFYARYTVWSGDFAWGDRYVSTAVQFAAFISVPLLLRHRTELNSATRIFAVVVIAASVIVQVASVMFWCPLEIYQMETFGHPTWVIGLRLKNVAALALGKMGKWSLRTEAMKQDPWDYIHISAYNFLPFLLKVDGHAARWVVRMLTAFWFTAVAALIAVLAWFVRVLTEKEPGGEAAAPIRATASLA